MKKLHKMKVDFVIVNTRFYIHSLFGVAFAKKKGIPSIIIEHGTNHFTVNNVFFDALGHIYEHLITSIEKKLCKNYYGVSKACNQWLEHFDIKAKGCLYNGIFIEDIEKILCKKNEDCRIKYGLPHNAKFIFFAGRLVKEKGIEKLIKAVEQLEEKNIYLLVAGDGDLYNQLIEEKHANVIFLGKISYESVICLMKDAEVFCFPTDYPEGFPTVVLEAAAAKCFVITTQAGGSQELIINEKYGIIMHENTIEEIRDSLSKALHIDKKPMIERTYQRLGACFTWEQTCKKLMEIYLNAEIKK